MAVSLYSLSWNCTHVKNSWKFSKFIKIPAETTPADIKTNKIIPIFKSVSWLWKLICPFSMKFDFRFDSGSKIFVNAAMKWIQPPKNQSPFNPATVPLRQLKSWTSRIFFLLYLLSIVRSKKCAWFPIALNFAYSSEMKTIKYEISVPNISPSHLLNTTEQLRTII